MDALVFGLFGLIVGSFLNVLILRGGVRTLTGRSACMSCGREILWYDLIPVFSWLLLQGKCRFCHSKISWQYPLVELMTALLFACLGTAPVAITLRLLGLPIVAILIAIAVYDIRHTIIPNAWAYFFGLCALVFYFVSTPGTVDLRSALIELLGGIFVALPLFILWYVSGGRWMGLGDSKLALGIGWLLGPLYGIVALFLAFIIGAFVSVFILLPLPHIVAFFTPYHFSPFGKSGKGLTMKSEVPFGPFLAAACLFVWIAQMYGIPLLIWQ
ncbi:MAG: prepilin peptidase [bacterium]|nr:prepilin peptidase [bacterium]